MCLGCGHICSSMRTHMQQYDDMCVVRRKVTEFSHQCLQLRLIYILHFVWLFYCYQFTRPSPVTTAAPVYTYFFLLFFAFVLISLPVASGHSSANFCIHVCSRSRYRYIAVSGHKCSSVRTHVQQYADTFEEGVIYFRRMCPEILIEGVITCVLILLHMCPHTDRRCSLRHICPEILIEEGVITCVLILLHMCPHTDRSRCSLRDTCV